MKSSTAISNPNISLNTNCGRCNLSDEDTMYDWELVDSKALQTALNFRDELKSWNNNEKELKKIIYTINKGYIALRLNQLPDKTTIEEIRELFKQAHEKCDPKCIVRAWTLTQNFSRLLNKDMARIVMHDINKECSKFSCDTLYTTQDGTKAIASILFRHPDFTTYEGTVYRGINLSHDLPSMQVNCCVMTNTFLSTTTDPDAADAFASYDRTNQKFTGDDEDGVILVFCTYKIKNLNGNRRALDISALSKFPDEAEILLLPYGPFLITKRSKTINLPNQKTKILELELEECDKAQLEASVTRQNL